MDLTTSNLPPVATDSEDKSDEATSHQQTVKAYATRVFQESTIGILSSIFSSQSNYRRCFKIFLSSFCLAGFLLSSYVLIDHVSKNMLKSWNVEIDIEKSGVYIMPAYTYCNNNPINRSIFCSMYPQHCVGPSEEFCEKFSSYCGANPTLIPKKEYYHSFPENFKPEWILNLGSVPNVLNIRKSNITTRTEEADEISGPYLRNSGNFDGIKACYSIHSLIESNQKPLQKTRTESIYPFPDEVIRFYINETEMMDPRSEPGVYFSIHSPFEAGNPLETGIYLKGGRTYKFHVEMQIETLLQYPYEENCLDYDFLMEKKNHTGSRTKKMCLEKCTLDFRKLQRTCIHYTTLYPHKERICEINNASNHTRPNPETEDDSSSLFECRQNCLDECRPVKYMTEFTIKYYVDEVEDEELYRHIQVEIYLSNEVKVFRHVPAYTVVDVNSSFGGLMGFWLGIAVLDIFDFVLSIISVCMYAVSKMFLYCLNKIISAICSA